MKIYKSSQVIVLDTYPTIDEKVIIIIQSFFRVETTEIYKQCYRAFIELYLQNQN